MVSADMQLGKNGLTENFVKTLQTYFQLHNSVRISVLKSARDLARCDKEITGTPRNRSAGHEKEKVKKYSEEILEKLGKNYTAKIIGFKIVLKKWRKARR